jgi:predicted metallo-beta-lactamase superfamily hydrolase
LGVPHGGYCPKGRLSEAGIIPDKYTLQETESDEYAVRTKLNITSSDGTWVLLQRGIEGVTDGTVLTIEMLQKNKKPYLILDISMPAREWLLDWIKQHQIKVLNIAGPRESSCPGIT